MKIHNIDQQSDEWIEIKLGKLSASDAQAIAANGAGLETLAYKKAAEILSGIREDTYVSFNMERGNRMERVARRKYEQHTGNAVTIVGFCELDSYVGASPDGLVGAGGLVEIKCPSNSNYVKALHTQKISTQYEWQMQFQMYVTNRKWVDHVVFNENFESLIIIRVPRDKAKVEKIKAGIKSGVSKIEKILEEVKQ